MDVRNPQQAVGDPAFGNAVGVVVGGAVSQAVGAQGTQQAMGKVIGTSLGGQTLKKVVTKYSGAASKALGKKAVQKVITATEEKETEPEGGD